MPATADATEYTDPMTAGMTLANRLSAERNAALREIGWLLTALGDVRAAAHDDARFPDATDRINNILGIVADAIAGAKTEDL